jgi:hypothetical protein
LPSTSRKARPLRGVTLTDLKITPLDVGANTIGSSIS